MLVLDHIGMEFRGEPLFRDINFHVNEGEKIALCGRNGSGKSTLLKIISSEITPSFGTVSIQSGKKIGRLRQFLPTKTDSTVFEECLKGFETIQLLKKEIVRIENRLMEDISDDDKVRLSSELSDHYHALELLDVYSMEKKASGVLHGLGFDEQKQNLPVGKLSGGWRMRVELAKLLVQNPDIMLLDEPTNHLDIASIQWLEEYLREYKGTLILISHDRVLLDKVTSRTLDIVKGKLYDYPCAYSQYEILRKERMEQMRREQQNQEKYIQKTQDLIEKFRYKASKAAFAQSLIKKLDKLERIQPEDDINLKNISLRFMTPQHCGKLVCEIKKLHKSYDEKKIFSDVDLILSKGEKVALVGKNGEGKSTFMKILAGLELPTSGSIRKGHQVLAGTFMQNEENQMDESKTVLQTVDEIAEGEVRKQLREILGAFLFSGDDIHKKVSVLSGGERVRLLLCKMLLKPYNFLILDEPTHHLDMASKQVLKQALLNYPGTYIIVSHDRDFMEGLYNRIFVCENQHIIDFPGSLNDYLLSLRQKQDNSNEPPEKVKEKVQQEPIEQRKSKSPKKINTFRLEKIEKEIFELEEKKTNLEERMNNGIYSKDDYALYLKITSDLEALYKEWTSLLDR